MLGVALELAIGQRRVLLEVPVNGSWQHANAEGVSRLKKRLGVSPRWCDRPPYTLQCIYKEWTHCAPPADIHSVAFKPTSMGSFRRGADYPLMLVKLTWIQGTHGLWMGKPRVMSDATMRFLFRPRPWVEQLGDCVMRSMNLQPQRFFSVHLRWSPEKEEEVKRQKRVDLPRLPAYYELSAALSRRLQQRHVFVQTASPSALGNFSRFARHAGLQVSYTDNPRSEHDAWGGWSTGGELLASTVAAVNSYISSHASAVVSPSTSVWTAFLWVAMPLGTVRFSYCCSCNGRGNLKVLVGSTSWEDVADPTNLTKGIDMYGIGSRSRCRFGFKNWKPSEKQRSLSLRLIVQRPLVE